MFRKKVIQLLILFVIYLLVVLLYLHTISTDTYKEYQRLIESSTPDVEKEKPVKTNQIRQESEKSLWLNKNHQRLHLRLRSESSELVFQEEMWAGDIVENLHQITGWVQEELYYLTPDGKEATLQENGKLLIKKRDPNQLDSWLQKNSSDLSPMQRVRYFESDAAQFNYTTSILTCENVTMVAYEIPGHSLPEIKGGDNGKIVMRGIAESVKIQLEGDDVGIKAGKIRASFYDE